MFLIGTIGVFALFSENRCLLGSYFSLVTVLLGIEIAGVVLIFLYRQDLSIYVKDVFDEALKSYGQPNATRLTQNFDFVQWKLQCCGEFNYTDWQHTWWYEQSNAAARWGQVPQSCCVNFVMNAENNNQLINTVISLIYILAPKYSKILGKKSKIRYRSLFLKADSSYPEFCYNITLQYLYSFY